MRGIAKSFPGVRALAGVDFTLRPGEVHAIMGENGAGKSTLIKVLTGVYPRERGEVLLDGASISPKSPLDAQRLGIAAIHQEVELLPYLSVAENIFIGRQPRRRGKIDWRTINTRAAGIMRVLGLDIDVTLPLGRYPVAIRQMTSVARAVDQSCRVLVMDEPTSSLDDAEVAQLFEAIRRLESQGTGIIFITHFLDQVYGIADRITVLRNGERVGTFETGSLPKLALVSHMLGKPIDEIDTPTKRREAESGQARSVFLEARCVGRAGSMKPFDLEIRKGEVLGLAGLLGSGRSEIARLLFGIDGRSCGSIAIGGRRVGSLSPRSAMRLGIGYSPEDRRSEGIIPDLSVRDNIVLAIHKRLSRFGLISRRRQRQVAEEYVAALGIATPSTEQPVKFLSGGNQQKVILARWLATHPELLILDEPTRGIDVGAKAEIAGLIDRLSREGMAILFISSELEEVVRLSDRIAVLRDREKIAEVPAQDATEQNIMRTIAGGESVED